VSLPVREVIGLIVLGPAHVWTEDGVYLGAATGGVTVAPSYTRTDFDAELEERRDDEDVDYSGWYCVRTARWPCPAEGCDFVAVFSTAAHLIVVWPRKDDPMLLANAHNCRLVGRDPRIVEYEPDFGPCIAWDVWERLGRPIHGKLKQGDDYHRQAKERL
jgi:hypothetical protein